MKEDEQISKAVAIRYNPNEDISPRVVAKGRGVLAELIKKIAMKEKILLYENKELVDILEKIEINYEIPEFLYEIMAELLAFAYNIGKKREFSYDE